MDPPARPSTTRQKSHSRSFSFGSNKSNEKSQPSSPKDQAEKARRDSFLRGESKANPNAAINEAQPIAAAFEKTTLSSIRDIEHKDENGNPIADPDLSNPTRNRWERPLDTIRSFERAIDGGYQRRSISRAETYDNSDQYASRRSSFFGGYGSGQAPSRHSHYGGGYYGNRRPESAYMDNQSFSGYHPRQRFSNRMQSEPNIARMNQSQHQYGNQHGYHQSADTFNTGNTNGSDSTGPWANSTDPSSEASSLDRYNAVKGSQTPEPMNSYGFEGFGNAPILEDHPSEFRNDYPPPQQNHPANYGQRGHPNAPPPPPHAAKPYPPRQAARAVNDYDTDDFGMSHQGGQLPTTRRPKEEKRKSWLARRFSKKE